VNDGPDDDPDQDGIINLMEFTLGSAPAQAGQGGLHVLLKSPGGVWPFEYERSDLSLSPATPQVVVYGSTRTGWNSVVIPLTSSGIVTITPGSPSDHVKVTLPVIGAKVFARLKVTR
jgi:hypothetical protein